MTTITGSVEEVPICEHPQYNTPKNDWGVIPAHTDLQDEPYWEGDGEAPMEEVFVPEDRSGWIPEWDGKSLADIMREFPNDPRNPLRGITHFLKPVITTTQE